MSLLAQRAALTESFNKQAADMAEFATKSNPLAIGDVAPEATVVEQWQKMFDAQVKTREDLDKVEEAIALSTQIKAADVDSDADIDARRRADAAYKALSESGANSALIRRTGESRFVKNARGQETVNADAMAQMVGNYMKAKGVTADHFERNGSTNLKMVFAWGEGEQAFSKDPQRSASGVIEAKSLRKLDEDAMKSLFTYSVNNAGWTNGGPGELGFACNLDIDNDICLIENPDTCIMDCITTRRTNGGRIWYTRQSVRTNNAAGVAEALTCNTGVVKPESQYGFQTLEVPVITIAHTICVSDEAMDDCNNMVDIVRGMLREDLQRRERQFIIAGNAAGAPNPQYRGLLATPNIVSHTFRSTAGGGRGMADDTIFDAIRRARTDIMLAGKTPDCVWLSVLDAEKMDLTKDKEGNYLFPNASCGTPDVWCLNVCADADMPQGTMVVGGFRGSVTLYRRQEVVVEVGYTNEQFRQDTLTIRAKMRGAFAVKCPQGIVRVGGIV